MSRVPVELYQRGACVGKDQDLWFPGRGPTKSDEAKAICAGCPVRKLCLEYALEAEEEFGVWGGTTPTERKRMKLKNRPEVILGDIECGPSE